MTCNDSAMASAASGGMCCSSPTSLTWEKLSPAEFQQLQDFAACKLINYLFWHEVSSIPWLLVFKISRQGIWPTHFVQYHSNSAVKCEKKPWNKSKAQIKVFMKNFQKILDENFWFVLMMLTLDFIFYLSKILILGIEDIYLGN